MLTGNVRNAGTNANVYITLFGEKEQSLKTKLGNNKDNFEKGKSDHFKIKVSDVFC